MGHEVIALCIWSGSEEAHPNGDKLVNVGIECRFHPFTHFSYPLVHWILEQAQEINPDIFIPDVSVQGCMAGNWIKKAGIPVINTHRSDDELNNGKAEYFTHGPEKWRSSGIICVSKYLQKTLFQGKLETIPSIVIPSGVTIPEKISNQRASKLKICYAGRLADKQKNLNLILNSFIYLAKKYPELQFSIVGSGDKDAREKYENMISDSGYSEQIQFTGKLQGKFYKDKLAEHQIMVLLSDYEGTPGAIMDGMSCGLVPVCLKIPGIDELVIHNRTGLLANDKEQSFINSIIRLIKDKSLRQELSENARNQIIKSFSIQYSANKWESFCRNLLEKRIEKKAIEIPSSLSLPPNSSLLTEHRAYPTLLEKLTNRVAKMTKI